MEVLTSKAALAGWLKSRGNRRRVVVPTMGALHRGHTSLFDLAGENADSGDVIATIFVNPTQFGPNEDFDAYPRRLQEDLDQCEAHGVSAAFAPDRDEMYQGDASISIRENQLSARLCGASRPGHFDGVCTIVAKLFLLTQADAAVFGEKDFQQLAVIRRLVRDLDFPLEIIPGPTVREADGLAMSSRNAYLSSTEREQAPVIYRSLANAAKAISSGDLVNPAEAQQQIHSQIEEAEEARVDYIEIVNSESLIPLESFGNSSPRLLAAVRFGKTRLIDNVGVPSLNGSGPVAEAS